MQIFNKIEANKDDNTTTYKFKASEEKPEPIVKNKDLSPGQSRKWMAWISMTVNVILTILVFLFIPLETLVFISGIINTIFITNMLCIVAYIISVAFPIGQQK